MDSTLIWEEDSLQSSFISNFHSQENDPPPPSLRYVHQSDKASVVTERSVSGLMDVSADRSWRAAWDVGLGVPLCMSDKEVGFSVYSNAKRSRWRTWQN
jgi:hypothetical protein